ncbi:MAG TPA: NAD(+) diphosphatase [Magnetospirillaceae bacterium]|nr:NAD(+) diphosphatase [Magnetospirillaceae bacterium]
MTALTRPNFFSGGTLDRASTLRRDEGRLATLLRESASKLFPVWRSHSLVKDDAVVGLPHSELEELLEEGETPIFLGLRNGEACFACDVSHHELETIPRLVSAGEFADIRQIGGQLSQADGALLAFARAMVHWHRTHRFCGRCGKPALPAEGGHVRRCTNPTCKHEVYPRTDPAVIMLVTAGDQCLLGRQAIWTPGMYSTLAGFVEPGETPEEAVAREVMEETGIEVTGSVRYHSSQPWPFPGSLMIGFQAEARRAKPRVDTHELETAEWFTRDEIRNFANRGMSLPRPISIARRLIEDWLAEGL